MRGISRHVALVVALLFLALTIRVAAAAWWQSRRPADQKFAFPDSESYWVLGGQIARGGPYEYGGSDARVFRTPGYPLLLAGLFALCGDEPPVLWARLAGALLGTLSVGGVYWLTRLLFDRAAAVLAAAWTAVYPGAVATSVFVLSEAFFCPLMLLQIILWVLAGRSKQSASGLALAALAGVAAGVATLVRPSWLLFTPVAAMVVLIFFGGRIRQLRLTVAMLVALVLTMSPWWIRNQRVVGRFVPTSLQVGASLYDGLNPHATGSSNLKLADQQLPDVRDEYKRDRELRRLAIQWAGQYPERVLQLAGIKFARMWNVWPNEAKFRSWYLRLAVMLSFLPAVVLAVCGAWWFARRDWPYLVCWLPAVYFTALHVVFVSSIRYRQPAMQTLIVLAAGVAVAAWRRWREVGGERLEVRG